MANQPLPLRFFYVENVFRFEELQADRQCELRQAGIELIGAATPEADAEVIALAITALRDAGITDFKIGLGQTAYFRALLDDLHLSPEQAGLVQSTLKQRNVSVLTSTLNDLGVATEHQTTITALPNLVGHLSVLKEARNLTDNQTAHAALDHLERVFQLLLRQELSRYLLIDLGEVGKMDYYTGIAFEAFAKGLGLAICSGGRYDALIGQFGEPLPAVGWAMGIERVWLILKENGRSLAQAAPHAVAVACDHNACRWSIDRLRADGLRVEYDVLGRTQDEVIAYAQQRGIGHVLACTGPGELNVIQANHSNP
jgi:ATP phosphoribosyltransferase regulatory subunit